MKAIVNTNNTTKALTVKKENSLVIVNKMLLSTVRVCSKSLLAAFVLSLLNMVV